MAYTTCTPLLISANLLHFGNLSGSCKLEIPKGWNKLKILTNKTEKIVVNCGTKSNYNVGGGYNPSEIISVPTKYGLIPNAIYITLQSSTLVSVEVIENKGVSSDTYFNEINEQLYSSEFEKDVSATPKVGYFKADGATRYSFSVDGSFVKYRWQISSNDGETWTDSTADGFNTKTISGVMQTSFAGRMYRCVVTNAFEEELISNIVLLELEE